MSLQTALDLHTQQYSVELIHVFFLLFADSFSEIQGSSERHVNEGSQLSLFCSIIDISGPPSFVFWYRDDTVVNYSDQGSGVRIVTKTNEADFKISRKNLHEEEAVLVSSLYIDTVKPEDAGKYTCAPSNARNHSVVVHVIKGKNMNRTVIYNAGQNRQKVHFLCF